MKTAIIGQGYVGLPLAIAAAAAGHDVIGIDINVELVEKLNKGESPLEDITDLEIAKVLGTGRYQASANYEYLINAEIVVICLPTPLDDDYNPDISILKSAVTQLVPFLNRNVLLINESTVAPGTTREIIAQLLIEVGVPFDLAFSPERIDPANKNWNVTNTPKLVAGLTEAATSRAVEFYESFVDTVVVGSSLEVVEMAKLLENSFRLINISFINEIAKICSAMNIDVREVITAATSKPYGFMPFFPSAGVGGHCIPIDPKYLSHKASQLGIPSEFIDLAHKVNLSMPTYFVNIARKMLGALEEKRILVIGIAYKSDVADIRESPAVGLISELRQEGAEVAWHDDLVKQWKNEISSPIDNTYELAILVNPHSNCNISELGVIPILNTRGGY